jgi:RsiW-degrading membrane proteinase PrsW (M82 family)
VGFEALLVVVGSILSPLLFVAFLKSRSARAEPSRGAVAVAAAFGIVVSLPLSVVLECLLPAKTGVMGGSMLIGVIEEAAKALAAICLVRSPLRRLSSHMDGLILGASIAMGFAIVEDALYGVAASMQGMAVAVETVWLRALAGPVTHSLWTAILVGTLWQERRGGSLRITPRVIGAFALVVVLHGIWDWDPAPGLGTLVAWLVIGAVGAMALRRQIAAARLEQRTALTPASAAQVVIPVARDDLIHAA